MPSPSQLRNGGNAPNNHHQHFHSTVSARRLRRVNTLILLLRVAAFCFCFAAAVFMFTNGARSANSPSWVDHGPFRFVLAANAIVALYSLFEMGASIREMLKGSTLLPEVVQLWFDFGHDQAFAYMLLSAEAAGTGEAAALRKSGGVCAGDNAFCVQADISVALGFAGFAFLAVSALLSGFRAGCYVITGSRLPF